MNLHAAMGYNQLRSCAQSVVDGVASVINCNANDCLCRSDIMSSAIVAINTSAVGGCSGNMIDATSAMGVYIRYCEANSYTEPAFAASISVLNPVGEHIHSRQFFEN